MITTIASPVPERRLRRRGGFTLTEVMVASGLAAMIMSAVLTAFLFMGRSTVRLQNYQELETEARTAIELFAQDARTAAAVTWHSAHSITLTSPTSAGGSSVTYTYDADGGTFTRQQKTPSVGTARVLISGINHFAFSAYTITADRLVLSDLDAAGRNTKQIQLSLSAQRGGTASATTSNKVISARFILRNKLITA